MQIFVVSPAKFCGIIHNILRFCPQNFAVTLRRITIEALTLEDNANIVDDNANIVDDTANIMDDTTNIVDDTAKIVDDNANIVDDTTIYPQIYVPRL